MFILALCLNICLNICKHPRPHSDIQSHVLLIMNRCAAQDIYKTVWCLIVLYHRGGNKQSLKSIQVQRLVAKYDILYLHFFVIQRKLISIAVDTSVLNSVVQPFITFPRFYWIDCPTLVGFCPSDISSILQCRINTNNSTVLSFFLLIYYLFANSFTQSSCFQDL